MKVYVFGFSDNAVNEITQAGLSAVFISLETDVESVKAESLEADRLDLTVFDFTGIDSQVTENHINIYLHSILAKSRTTLNYLIFNDITIKALQRAYETGIFRTEKYSNDLRSFIDQMQKDHEEKTRELAKNFSEQRSIEKLKKKLERETIRDSYRTRDQVEDAREIVRRLRNNFGNDSGLGALITATDILAATAIEQEGSLVVDSSLFQGMQDSAKMAASAFNAMNLFLNLSEKKLSTDALYLKDIAGIIDKLVQTLEGPARKAGIQLLYEKEEAFPEEIAVCDKKAIELTFKELIVNALKFSKEGDSVQILPVVKSRNAGLMVMNPAHEFRAEILGIPPVMEKKIFEPFYRISDSSNDKFLEHQIMSGLGLGLTLIQRLVQFHNGELSISNIESHSLFTEETSTRVIAEVTIPLQ